MTEKVIKSFKKDFAPMLFYFDLVPSEVFDPPVMPLPLRIDRLYSGNRTAFIHPDFYELENQLDNFNLKFNYAHFLETGLKNFIQYARKKVSSLQLRDYSTRLKTESIIDWFNSSCEIVFYNPDLEKDLTFILRDFIKLIATYFQKDLSNDSLRTKELLIEHCDKMIKYFRNKIEKNQITIIKEQEKENVKLSIERKSKFYPDIIEHDVVFLENYKVKKMKFVPYLIYDDILECYSYNKKLLTEGKESFYSIELWKRNHIINKRSNIKSTNLDDYDLSKFDISKVNIDKLL